MNKNEKFINRWEKNKVMGKTKYIASNILKCSVWYWVIAIIREIIIPV